MLTRTRRNFREWRQSRPFWAGLFVLMAAVLIMAPPFATFRLGNLILSISTIGGVSALFIGVLLIAATAALWWWPRYRLPAGGGSVLLALVGVVTSNLGGFVLGTVLGIVGGALALAWTDQPRPDQASIHRHHRCGNDIGQNWWWLTPKAKPSKASRVKRTVSAILVLAGVLSQAVGGWQPARADAAPATPRSQVFTLTSSKLELKGLTFTGVVDTPVDGTATQVLRFTANGLVIANLALTATVLDGHPLMITAAAGRDSTSTGFSELLIKRLRGNVALFGALAIPVDFSPGNPLLEVARPILNNIDLTFTDVNALTAEIRLAQLTIPGSTSVVS